MPSERERQFSDRIKGIGCFFLATLCASPFLFLSSLIAIAMLTGKEVISRFLVYSIFFLPISLLATVGCAIFSTLTWRNGASYFRPFLVIYSLAIIAYWALLIKAGPW
jgi:hypothetical protein